MRTRLPSVLFLILWSGAGPALGQLPPEILADSHLLRAEQAIRDGDPDRVRSEIDKIPLLQNEHQLDLLDPWFCRPLHPLPIRPLLAEATPVCETVRG